MTREQDREVEQDTFLTHLATLSLFGNTHPRLHYQLWMDNGKFFGDAAFLKFPGAADLLPGNNRKADNSRSGNQPRQEVHNLDWRLTRPINLVIVCRDMQKQQTAQVRQDGKCGADERQQVDGLMYCIRNRSIHIHAFTEGTLYVNGIRYQRIVDQ